MEVSGYSLVRMGEKVSGPQDRSEHSSACQLLPTPNKILSTAVNSSSDIFIRSVYPCPS